MFRRGLAFRELSRAFECYIDAEAAPGQLRWITFGADRDFAAADIDRGIAGGDVGWETPMHAVVFKEMRVGRDGPEIVNRNDLDVLAPGLVQRAQDQPADAPKAVDGYPYRHSLPPSISLTDRHCVLRRPRRLDLGQCDGRAKAETTHELAQPRSSVMNDHYVRWFEDVILKDFPEVGGKTASLGELSALLAADGGRVPDGFALTAEAYRDALTATGAWQELRSLLSDLDHHNVALLAERAAAARKLVYDATGNNRLTREIANAYRGLEGKCGAGVAVAVRSSATAEDLPNASFAGQHESFLNVRGETAVIEACRRCFASIFTDRAIVYRIDNGFDHFKVALSVGVMKMVRADLGASGVIFTLDTESGFCDVVFVTGIWGLGENIVQGKVDPDEFYVHKPTFRKGFRAVLSRALGGKQMQLIYASRRGATTENMPTPKAARECFCLTDAEVLELAGYAIRIEDHYSKLAGRPTPMDIEWAKDGEDGRLYIVQARPETAASRRAPNAFEIYTLKGAGPVLATGRAVGEKIASGKVRIVAGAHQLAAFQPGEVLVAESTSPDWEPVMKTAAAIVTRRGGRTCHAAIVARELGLPAVVGAEDAVEKLATGTSVTVSCADGEIGKVYDRELPFEVIRIALDALPRPRTQIMVNLGDPELAYHTAMLPNDGVGLARMEFIINQHIGVHPMALVHPEKVTSKKAQAAIARLVQTYPQPADFFVDKLSEGIGTIAAAFYPRPVIVRLSDFKTNEYANLIGGAEFEPKEQNPMLGFRGASRYSHPAYADGFALECRALARVRNEMGLKNLRVMVPFCRRVAEAEQVITTMAQHGLKQGDNELEIYVMCEIPNNVIQIDAFARLFDGFSIGSNDLTQLTLGVDRDSEIVAFDFDERDTGMLEMLRLSVTGAKRNHRMSGSAVRRRPIIQRLRSSSLGLESTRSASMLQVCSRRLPQFTRPSSGRRRPPGSRRSNILWSGSNGCDRYVDDEPGARHRDIDGSCRADPQTALLDAALRPWRRRDQRRARDACAGRRRGRDLPGGRSRRRNDPVYAGTAGCAASRDRNFRLHPRKPRRRGAPERTSVSVSSAGAGDFRARPGALSRPAGARGRGSRLHRRERQPAPWCSRRFLWPRC